MLGDVVLVGEKQECSCCDVIMPRSLGLGCLGFVVLLGFCGVLSLVFFFCILAFCVLRVYFMYA
jgi:hypothetical protein